MEEIVPCIMDRHCSPYALCSHSCAQTQQRHQDIDFGVCGMGASRGFRPYDDQGEELQGPDSSQGGKKLWIYLAMIIG